MIVRERFKAFLFCLSTAAFVMASAVALSRCAGLPPSGVLVPAAEPSPTVKAVIPTESGCCDKAWPGTHDGPSRSVRGTGYFPDASAMEGGFNDTHGKPLKTTQAYLAGKVDAVSVATDATIAPYGAKLCSPELNARFGKALPLERTDTGGAFKNKGWARMDLCTASNHDSLDSVVNSTYTVIQCQ